MDTREGLNYKSGARCACPTPGTLAGRHDPAAKSPIGDRGQSRFVIVAESSFRRNCSTFRNHVFPLWSLKESNDWEVRSFFLTFKCQIVRE